MGNSHIQIGGGNGSAAGHCEWDLDSKMCQVILERKKQLYTNMLWQIAEIDTRYQLQQS